MMSRLREWRRSRWLKRAHVDEGTWRSAWSALPLLQGLEADAGRLRELALLFLHEKSIEPAGGLEIDERMGLLLALQACLPVLNLGLDWYEGWVSVIVYPDVFVAEHEEVDETGVVHRVRGPLAGESWQQGPLVLSWSDVETGSYRDGYNVTIHEIAHKLDALNGPADGYPPLHPGMDRRRWTESFSAAYDDHVHRVENGPTALLDPYGAESPAEFFAVASEYFFEVPAVLHHAYPDVYAALSTFYQQRTLQRLR